MNQVNAVTFFLQDNISFYLICNQVWVVTADRFIKVRTNCTKQILIANDVANVFIIEKVQSLCLNFPFVMSDKALQWDSFAVVQHRPAVCSLGNTASSSTLLIDLRPQYLRNVDLSAVVNLSYSQPNLGVPDNHLLFSGQHR